MADTNPGVTTEQIQIDPALAAYFLNQVIMWAETEDGGVRPVYMEEFRKLKKSPNRRVAHDQIGEADVYTSFLAIDHSFHQGLNRAPILYETMIFGGDHDGFQNRYAYRYQAEEGHQKIIQALREGRNPEEVV